MQINMDLGDGHLTREQMVAAMSEEHPQLGRQLQQCFDGAFDPIEYFFPHEYDALIAWWAHERFGLSIAQMIIETDDMRVPRMKADETAAERAERWRLEAIADEGEVMAWAIMATQRSYDKRMLDHEIIHVDSQLKTISDWEGANEFLPGVNRIIEMSVCTVHDLRDLKGEAIFPSDAGLMFMDYLTQSLMPDFVARLRTAQQLLADQITPA